MQMYSKEKIDPELVSVETIEEWRPVVGYEGHYEVSNMGRIKSLERIKKNGKNSFQIEKEKILISSLNKGGYLRVVLCKYNKTKSYLVHRLVAQAFLENPNNYTEVNHIDENKRNNFVKNLEWCTAKYNNNYGTRTKRASKAKSKPVIQFTLEGEFVKEWSSASDAHRECGYDIGHICKCCRGVHKTHKGYIWKYK